MPLGGEGLRVETSYALGFFVETLLYGVYTCLFIAAMPAIARGLRKTSHQSRVSTWVFLVFTSMMYLTASVDIAVVFYRSLRATVLLNDPLGAVHYYSDVTQWEVLSNVILICIMTWLGDALVIYRTYIVWNRNVWLVALPVGLLVASFIVNVYVLVWLRNPPPFGPISFNSGLAAFNSIYIIAFAQNFITTLLLTLKIWNQYRKSRAAGAMDQSGRISLIRVARIIVESAMMYTLQLLVIIVLNFKHNNGQYVVQCAIVPSIGITFALIAVRVQQAKEEGNRIGTPDNMNPPSWIGSRDIDLDLASGMSGSSGKQRCMDRGDDAGSRAASARSGIDSEAKGDTDIDTDSIGTWGMAVPRLSETRRPQSAPRFGQEVA